MRWKGKMQYWNVEKFIFSCRKTEIGEMHKYTPKRQMFLLHNHTLLFPLHFNKILV